MNNLQDIILSLKPERKYRMRFAVELSKYDIDLLISRLMDKYDAFDFSPMQKTIFQVKPYGFNELDAGEIWIIDFKTHCGIQPDYLVYELSSLLKLSEALICVESRDEPHIVDDLDFDDVIDDEALLNKEDLEEVPDMQQFVGNERVDAIKSQYSKYFAAGYKE